MENQIYSEETQNEDFNFRDTFDKYINQWNWFVLSICLCLIFAFAYLRYTTPQYKAELSLLVKDDRKGGMLSDLSAFADLGITGGISNLDNEIEILKSRTLIENTIKKLGLNVSIGIDGNIVSRGVYKDAPIEVNFENIKSEFYANKMQFELLEISPVTFELRNSLETTDTLDVFEKKVFHYGEIIVMPTADLIIRRTGTKKDKNKVTDRIIIVSVSPLDDVVTNYQRRLQLASVSKTSSVVSLSLVDPVGDRAEDFLNNLVEIYNEDAAADKSYITENTSKFVANRLLLISEELGDVEKDVQRFKTSNKLTDMDTEAKLFLEGANEYNKKNVEVEIQLNMVASMLVFIKKSTNVDLLPTNVISGQGDASGLVDAYNELVLERNRILKSATENNPAVINIGSQIESLRSNVVASLYRMQSNLNIQKRDLASQEKLLYSKIGEIPAQEREFRIVARQQKVKEELYLYLLQKREETAITMAATAPNARVIDAAKASKNPVSPKKAIVYLGALFLGLLIPFGILYMIDLFDTKVKNRFDISEKLDIPFLGDIPHACESKEVIVSTDRSSTAEAMRIVRSNVDFMLNMVPAGNAKIIFVTSTIPGEGKTFNSINLASTFALSGTKVLLIGMDIRNPKFSEYMNLPVANGLTNYLSSSKGQIDDYIIRSDKLDNFYILPPGEIPPNPTELLMDNKIGEMFEKFRKEYDYVIVDTAPVSLVSDTVILSKFADTFVYVVRANVLDKRMLYVPKNLHKEKKLPNMAILLNDTDIVKGYGYGYGYGSKVDVKPWYKRIKF